MTTKKALSLELLRAQLNYIMEQHSFATEMDAGFDAGEWSGPEHDKIIQRELSAFQTKHGLSDDTMALLLHAPEPADPYEFDSVHGRTANA